MNRLIIVATTFLFLFGTQATANAPVTVENVKFEPVYAQNGSALPLRGAGLLRYMVFIKAYVGALYTPADIASAALLEDVPKRLEVEYFHALKGKDFGPATLEGLGRNVDQETLERLRPQIEYHNSLYVDVEPGDRYALTYWPGQGTTLELNGIPLGTIEGAEFAAALFSIWLGPNPISPQFKAALLGAS
jgi:hypothetical protein